MTSRAKQSVPDRLARLADGRCPLHGTAMPQVGNRIINGAVHAVVACPREDCNVQATMANHRARAVLTAEFDHLVTATATVTDIATRRG